jgi:hypothetical protein
MIGTIPHLISRFEIISPRHYAPQLSKNAGMLIDFKNH